MAGGFDMLSAMRPLALFLAAGTLFGQSVVTVSAPPYERPDSVADRLSLSDRELFNKPLHVRSEAAWAAVTNEGYPQCFINELHPLNTGWRMVARARTIRYFAEPQRLA